MSSSRMSENASIFGSESDVSIIDNIDELEDFVVVSPGGYSDHEVPDPSAHSSATATSDLTETSEHSRVTHSLLEKVSLPFLIPKAYN